MKKQLTQEEINGKYREVLNQLNGCNKGGIGSLRKLEKLLETSPASPCLLTESWRVICLIACDRQDSPIKDFALRLRSNFEFRYIKKTKKERV